MQTYLIQQLDELEAKSLSRSMRLLENAQGRLITIDGKTVLNFCSNNYLGLADDPRIVDAAKLALGRYGVGSGASRLVCGNSRAHAELEQTIRILKGTEACLVFNSGFGANTGIIPALYDRSDIIFSDRLNHASIVDGILLSRAEMVRYPHKDMAMLEKALSTASKYRRRLIVTDTVFSMDGDVAPLKEIVTLARRYDADVMVDEAHSFGLFGECGEGLVTHLGLTRDIDIQMGTLSKAAGVFGAYCCGSQALIDVLINRCRSFVYTTGMPPSIAAAAQKSVELLAEDRNRRKAVWTNAEFLRTGLRDLGFDTLESSSPIIPVLIKDAKLALEFSKRLFEEGVFVQAIRPPTVPVNTARLRVTVMATHTREDLETALNRCADIGRALCLI